MREKRVGNPNWPVFNGFEDFPASQRHCWREYMGYSRGDAESQGMREKRVGNLDRSVFNGLEDFPATPRHCEREYMGYSRRRRPCGKMR